MIKSFDESEKGSKNSKPSGIPEQQPGRAGDLSPLQDTREVGTAGGDRRKKIKEKVLVEINLPKKNKSQIKDRSKI